MRELLAREASDRRCRLAVAIYCYEIKKRIGAYAAALGGLDTLVFSGGIGEHAPASFAPAICERPGVSRHRARRIAATAPMRRSFRRQTAPASTVRVIPTDEEMMIARAAYDLVTDHGERS